jgi:hypothetical protein
MSEAKLACEPLDHQRLIPRGRAQTVIDRQHLQFDAGLVTQPRGKMHQRKTVRSARNGKRDARKTRQRREQVSRLGKRDW